MINKLKNLNNICLLFGVLLIITSILTLFTAYNFPIYPDEVAIRSWLSRLPYDFPYRISGMPRCVNSFMQYMPWTMYPAAIINWLLHGLITSPSLLRTIGIIIEATSGLILVYYLYYRIIHSSIINLNKKNRIYNFVISLSIVLFIFNLGVEPIFLIMNRSEQLIFPALIIITTLFIFTNTESYKFSIFTIILLIFIFLFSVTIILFSHPKGIFLTPIFLLVAFKLMRLYRKIWLNIFLCFILAFILMQDILLWNSSYVCSEMPDFEKFFN